MDNACQNLDGYRTTIYEEDVELWEREGRWDIIEWVECYEDENGVLVNEIWFNPKTREEVTRCPWLRKRRNKNQYYCRIHDVKPTHCREYPLSVKHARFTDCPGFDQDKK